MASGPAVRSGMRAARAAQERRRYYFSRGSSESPGVILVARMNETCCRAFGVERFFILQAERRQPINSTRSSARRCV